MPRPDDGLIHAWLDEQLPADEAARVEHLIATDAAWSAAAAEARGLVAASSRILAALDDVPRGVLPAGSLPRPDRRLPWWTKAAAAVVVMVGVSTLVLQRTPTPTVAEVARAPEPTTAPRVGVAAEAEIAATAAKTAGTARTEKVAAPPPVPRTAVVSSAVPALAAAPEQRDALPVTNVPALQPRPVPFALQGVQGQQVGDVAAQRVAERRKTEPSAAIAGGRAADVTAPKAFAATPAPVTPRVDVGACYSMRNRQTSIITGTVMRGDRLAGDTLMLAPILPSSPARGWVVARDGLLHGVLTTEPDSRGMMLVTATPVACPVP